MKWYTEPPERPYCGYKGNCLIKTLIEYPNGRRELGYVVSKQISDKEYDGLLYGGYGPQRLKRFAVIEPCSSCPAAWHGDFTDGEEPPKRGRYLVTCSDRPNHYRITELWRDGRNWGKTYGDCGHNEVIGWLDKYEI
jgi:hypothetical protein